MLHTPARRARAGVLAVIACVALPARAQSTDALTDVVQRQAAMLERLDARVRELEKQIEELRAPLSAGTIAAPIAAPGASTASATAAPTPQSVSSSVVATAIPATPPSGTFRFRGGPEWTAADGIASVKLRGRLQSEFWGVSGSDSVDYPSGSLIRAVRLGLEGRINPVLSYVAEIDFGVGQTVINDAYLQYKGKGPFFVRAGNIKPDFSLENMTGVHQTTFMERALPNTFAISDETLAVAIGTSGRNWSFGATVFGDTPGIELDGDEGRGFSSRVTYAPILSGDRLLHIGASAYRRHLGADAGLGFRIRQRPESRVFLTRLVDTGRIDADDFTVIGAEFATVRGPWSLQAEHLVAKADLRNRSSREFSGSYVFGSWFATGESRTYSASNGKFARLKPKRAFGEGGPGALEFALRYSTLDLVDGPVLGGTEDNFTLGVNWYLTEYSKLMFNWVHFDISESGAATPLGYKEHEGDALGLRVQVDW